MVGTVAAVHHRQDEVADGNEFDLTAVDGSDGEGEGFVDGCGYGDFLGD